MISNERHQKLFEAAKLYSAAVKMGYTKLGEPVGTGKMSAVTYIKRQLDLTQGPVFSRVQDAISCGYVTQDGKLLKKKPDVVEVKKEEPVKDTISTIQEVNLVTRLKSKIRELENELVTFHEWKDKLDSIASVDQVKWVSPSIRKENSLIPILFTSDFQCGEVIKASEIDGINEYNENVFIERYQAMIDKTIQIAENNTGATDYPGCIYLRGGDAISGEIHQELAETNDLSAIPAIRLLQKYEREGIRKLKAKFGRVKVISIPGNHGRTTLKPRAKRYHDLSFETLLTWWLTESFSDDPNVTFYSPSSGDAWFKVFDWAFLLSHGDRMGSRGGQGFIGPAATIARGHKKLYDNWSLTGRPVNLILTGHLHTSLKLELGYANGALAGYSEYARDFRATPDAAKQWLLFAHRDVMISHQFELQLSQRPNRIVEDK